MEPWIITAFAVGVLFGALCTSIGVLLGRGQTLPAAKAPAASLQVPVRPGARAKPPQPFVPGAAAKAAAEERVKHGTS